jgi:hypothetical protein
MIKAEDNNIAQKLAASKKQKQKEKGMGEHVLIEPLHGA